MAEPFKVYVYTHTHWDREWYRSFQEYRFRLIEVVDDILDQLDSGSLDCFTLDGQAIVLEDYLDVKPENKDRLIRHIKEGRLEAGPWYVLPDEFLVSGESLIMNLYLGHRLTEKYGKTTRTGYLPDSFGHSIDIPAILKKFNINNALLWRGINADITEFNWLSQDNNSVKTYHLREGYYINLFENNNTDITKIHEIINSYIQKIKAYTTLNYMLLPVGGDHMPAPQNFKGVIKDINNHQNDYKLIPVTLTEFMILFEKEQLKDSYQQEFRDCTRSYILPGVYSSRLYLKQENARLTNKINRLIEPLACYCNAYHLDKFRLPDTDYLWKMLIENHPHDSICGCSVDPVHDEMEQRFKSLHQACDEYINRAKLSLIKQVPTGKIAVFNTSNFTYSGPVLLNTFQEDDTGLKSQLIDEFTDTHPRFYSDIKEARPATILKKQQNKLVWADEVPAGGLKILDSAEIPAPVREHNGNLTNGIIEIKVDKDSISVKDLKTGETYHNLNQIIDKRDAGDSYNFGPIKGDTPVKARITSSRIKENGPIRGMLEAFYEIDIPDGADSKTIEPISATISHYISCYIIMYANSKIVEFRLNWDNKSRNHLLQAVFPSNSLIYKTDVENHCGILSRSFDPEYDIYNHIPASKQTELKTNTAPMQRFVQANNIAIFNEGLPEYEVFKSNLYLTLLRATGYLSVEHPSTRGAYAGPELSTPGNQCLRQNTARYAFHPASTPEELFRLAESFCGCTISLTGENKAIENFNPPESLISLSNPDIITTSMRYYSKSDSIVIRLLNISKDIQTTDLHISLPASSIQEVNFLNEPFNESLKPAGLKLAPCEMKACLINVKTE
jgi:bifunctional DNA-binding transcriptional regulator/antitoxin component of YhaV-PrlF toxin-antitoxin module